MSYRPSAVLVDMDGTLSDPTHRRHLVEGKDRNYTAFFHGCGNDPVHQHVADLVNLLSSLHRIVVVTGRPARFATVTTLWLGTNDIHYDAILTRADNDFRSDDIIKEEILDRDILPFYTPAFVLDDRDRVVAMWRRRGIPCLQVAPGAF